MKKLLSVCLILALLFAAASCAGDRSVTNGGTEKASPSDAQTTASPQPIAENILVEPSPAGYEITCEVAENPGAFEGPAFDCSAVSAGSRPYVPTDFAVTVTETASGKQAFRILITAAVSQGLLNLHERENVSRIGASLRARRGDTWLFSIDTEPEEAVTYFLFDAKAASLAPVGIYDSSDIVGQYFTMQKAVYAEEAPQPVDLFDWTGKQVYSYPDIFDSRFCLGYLYLITGGTAPKLLGVPQEQFSAAAPDFSAQTLCSLNGWSARFSYEDYGYYMICLTAENGHEYTCPIGEAPYYVGGVNGENLSVTGAVTESCGMFSVTLPDYWKDKYICERDNGSLTFLQKSAEESPDRASYGSLVFTLSAAEEPYDLRETLFGDSSVEVCRLYSEGVTYDITLYEPGEAICPPECRQEYLSLRAALLGSPLYRIEDYIQGAAPGSQIELFDYSAMIGEYKGLDRDENYLQLVVDSASRNVLKAEINWQLSIEPYRSDFVQAEIRMFGNHGTIRWTAPNGNYSEEEGFSATYGDGYLRVEGGELIWMELNDEGDIWTNTLGEVALTRVD